MLTVDGRKGRPFWLHISTQKKTDGHQRPYRLPFPIYKIVSYAPRGVKERTRRWTDNKSHGILLSISSRRCRFLSFHIPFFSILNISHLSRSPGQRLYVIFWSFFFDFFFSLSLTWWNCDSLSLGVLVWVFFFNHGYRQLTNRSNRPVGLLVSGRFERANRQLAATIHLENNNHLPLISILFGSILFCFIPSCQTDKTLWEVVGDCVSTSGRFLKTKNNWDFFYLAPSFFYVWRVRERVLPAAQETDR